MDEAEEERAAIVECVHCGTPGIVRFKGEEMTAIFIVCKCPRPSVKKANAMARRKLSKR